MLRCILATLSMVLAGSGMAHAQTTAPASAPAALAALDRDVQQLFRRVQQRTVRVSVPIHLPASMQQEHPLAKWGERFDSKLKQQLDAARARGAEIYVEQRPATTQATAVNGEGMRVPLPATTVVDAEFIGLVINESGDVLVPLHIDPAYAPPKLLVTLDEQHVTTATVIGSDRLTSMSVIRLAEPPEGAVQFASSKPAAGSMVLLLSPTRRAARLSVWTGGTQENAVVVNLNGEIAGIARNGHVLYPGTILPITEQLIETGRVDRATLGVYIRDVPPQDPRRAELAALGARAAALVVEVAPQSQAQRAGVQRGDLIIGFAGEAVEDVATFAAAIASRRGKTDLRIIREGKEQTIAVDLQPE